MNNSLPIMHTAVGINIRQLGHQIGTKNEDETGEFNARRYAGHLSQLGSR
jgi:hypothetical protein